MKRSERAIAASGIIKAKRLSLNWAPENIAKAPIAVKFQICGISRGNALVKAAQTINIVKTKNRGDLICSVMHQNYKFFREAKQRIANLQHGLFIPLFGTLAIPNFILRQLISHYWSITYASVSEDFVDSVLLG